MCGRFTQSYTWRKLVELYRLTVPARNLRPRYNIAPTTTIDVLRLAETGPELVPMRWGLIPGWWKKTAKEVPSTFNAGIDEPRAHPHVLRHSRATHLLLDGVSIFNVASLLGDTITTVSRVYAHACPDSLAAAIGDD